MPEAPGAIFVLAGTNGAGKSSLMGAMLRAAGTDYYNPDEAARRLRTEDPALSLEEANGIAWSVGRDYLQRAIATHGTYAFETTLGGRTIPRMLGEAARAGLAVQVWYVGLASADQHVARVRARVEAGGHDIPEARIRERYEQSLLHLIDLLPHLTTLHLYDNSAERDPRTGQFPAPSLLLQLDRGVVRHIGPLDRAPAWSKPVLAAVIGRG